MDTLQLYKENSEVIDGGSKTPN
jgi:hypothetical protein